VEDEELSVAARVFTDSSALGTIEIAFLCGQKLRSDDPPTMQHPYTQKEVSEGALKGKSQSLQVE
jgi:hypothetical protein